MNGADERVTREAGVVMHPSSDEASRPTKRIRFLPEAPPLDATTSDELAVVLDTAWFPAEPERSTRLIGVLPVVERVLERRDVIAEAAAALDRWAEAADVVGHLAIDGVSFWYEARLGQWMWLLDRLVWLAVVDELLGKHPGVRELACDAGVDESLALAVRLIAERDGLVATLPRAPSPAAGGDAADLDAAMGATAPPVSTPPGRARLLLRRLRRRLRPPEPERRRRAGLRHVDAIGRDRRRRLLVVQAHARQRIDTPTGTRFVNPYLGPIADRLAGTRLEPFEVDIKASTADPEAWSRLVGAAGRRTIPGDLLGALGADPPAERMRADAEGAARSIRSRPVELRIVGVDLGPLLAEHVADWAATHLGRRRRDVARIRALLRRVHPAGILLADEYHRQDWLAAAGAEGIPVAAVQHGVIYRWHNGYIHSSRPAQLRLPDRTYVYGQWERDLLTTTSVYRPDEVVVGGSPRLDLVDPAAVDPGGLRAELGVAPDERLVVLSGTWGPMYRRFHYPIALAHLFDRPLDRIHLVVKLHPSERDEGPYRRILEGLAAAGGFAPPRITVVQAVDLYRLLAAADAHLGIHSTLLTEAVATGTPNLLAAGLEAADLLGYVEAGVAIPVRNADDLRAALELPRATAVREAERHAFLRRHFEPGDASGRIAADLLGWLA